MEENPLLDIDRELIFQVTGGGNCVGDLEGLSGFYPGIEIFSNLPLRICCFFLMVLMFSGVRSHTQFCYQYFPEVFHNFLTEISAFMLTDYNNCCFLLLSFFVFL